MTVAWRLYLGLGVLLAGGYFLLPEGLAQDGLYMVLGLSSVAAVATGVRRHRPDRPWSWRLLAAGLLLWVAADTVYAFLQHVLHIAPFPSAADVLYLLAYPVLAAGLVVLIRTRERGVDAGGLVDSATVTIAAGLLSWVCLARPVLAEAGSMTVTVVSLAYPASDVVLLGLLVHLVIVPGARTVSFRLLVAATGLLVVADTAYAVGTAAGGDGGVLAFGGWLGQYLLAGTAALHPSMVQLSRRSTERTPPVTTRRLAALTAAVLVAPGTLAVQLLRGGPVSGWAVVVGSVALFLLVVVRMQAALREVVRGARQRDRLQDDLAHQAAHDPLTALANRARVLELVEAALHRARRSGTAVGLLFLDLDRFKAVNDTLGHRAGDEVLRQVAERMRAHVRAGDTVGRLGGDEFVVLVEALETPAELVELAERLVAVLAEPVVVTGREVVVGASAGVAVSLDGGTDASQLLHHADAAAYRAKALGRGRAEVFDEALRAELEARAELERAVRHGLAAGEFVLHYQPVVDLDTGRVGGHEALVRWQRPGHGLVAPDAFVPTAELSGLICDLGRWVLHEATGQLAAWRREDPQRYGGTTVAVNVSGRHVASAEVLTDVHAALAASGLPASGLVLEITETVLVDQATADVQLRALRALGVGISIDDFGTGYTSIGQLRHLQADTLKIDRSFVGSDDAATRALVGLMIQAAHAFGLTVVAEGVESADQVDPLRRLDCDAAQGYLFARPQPAAALAQALAPTF